MLSGQPRFQRSRDETTGKEVEGHCWQGKKRECRNQLSLQSDTEYLLVPLNHKLQQVFGDHVEDNRQQDDVDVDCYKEDQAGVYATCVR